MVVVRRILRRPEAQFVVVGVLLFALHRAVAPRAPSRRIEVGRAAREALAQDHRRRSGVEPTAAELDALVRRYVETEVLAREAVSLGLDRGDTIVRRRLVQKMELLLEAEADARAPTDAELRALAARRADADRLPERRSFTHVFVSRDRHPDAAAEAARLRRLLDGGADAAALGDPFLRGRAMALADEREVAAAFGEPFARALFALDDNATGWSAPIASSYGLHLVRVTERRPPEAPPFEAIRARLRRAWEEERRAEARRTGLQRLVARYDVRVAP